MPTLTVIVGLPGSGKSWLLNEMKAHLSGLAVSDYMQESLGSSSKLKKSRHFKSLLEALESGHDCIIDDNVFVLEQRRAELVSTIQSKLSDVTFRWIYFEKDWIQCLKNVDIRSGADAARFESDAPAIVALVRKYTIPENADVRPVAQAVPLSSVTPWHNP